MLPLYRKQKASKADAEHGYSTMLCRPTTLLLVGGAAIFIIVQASNTSADLDLILQTTFLFGGGDQ